MSATPAMKTDTQPIPQTYFETIQLIERLHRFFLDVLKIELEKLGVQDINNIQTMILYNIGNDELTVGELTIRGYYLGSNVSYNVKKMVENGYLIQERSIHDRRSVRVKLSEKGLELKTKVDGLFQDHADSLSEFELSIESLQDIAKTLRRLERFWSKRANPVY